MAKEGNYSVPKMLVDGVTKPVSMKNERAPTYHLKDFGMPRGEKEVDIRKVNQSAQEVTFAHKTRG